VAGAERVVRDIELHATGVRETTLRRDLTYRPGHWCDGIGLLDVSTGVGLRIDVPGTLEVQCARLRIDVGEERVVRFQPWLSEAEFGLSQPGGQTPPPEEWLRRFADHGIAVDWRLYGDPRAGTPPNPEDYTGWHLQLSDRLPSTSGGLMFFACGQHDGAFVLQFTLREDESEELRQAAFKVMADFSGAEIWCGNCQVSTEEWRSYLATGRLPKRVTSGGGE